MQEVQLFKLQQLAVWRLQQAGHDLVNAQFDTQKLLEHVLNCSTSFLYTYPETQLNLVQQEHFEQLITQRSAGVPVAYLTGEVGFWRLQLLVNASTLIPRPETELLVSTALSLMQQHNSTSLRVLDLGTGTGAVALALAQEKPDWIIRGYDRVPEVVALARENATRNGLSAVQFFCHDWFRSMPEWPCDLVLSNPPYIDACDPHLIQGDVRYEPLSALVAEDSGLADLRQVVLCACQLLRPSGYLLLEHGFQQGEAVRQLLQAAGYENLLIQHDLQNHWRVSGGQWMG